MENGKYVIVRRNGQILSLLFHGSRLHSAHAQNAEEGENLLGSIYVAKVKNVVKNLHAAFVEIEAGRNCFLDLRDVKSPLLLNRKYDGKLAAGDEVVVQVYKEAVKTKPPSVTCALSLDGKYCVVTKGRAGIAYSAKLSAKTEEKIGMGLRESPFPIAEYAGEYGIIIRTNARDLADDVTPLAEEIRDLACRLAEIMQNGIHRTCYSVLMQKPPAYLWKLRDLHTGWCDEIVTDDEGIYREILAFSNENQAYRLPPVRLYQDGRLPLSKLYAVESRLKEALERKVWLKSGGYLLIEPTEALTVIDVNTGKVVSRKEAADNHFLTNMEAAEEIAHQLILRNLSGIVIVDFINMPKEEHRHALMQRLGGLLREDTVKTQLVDITALGLVEITRMKTSRPLGEQLGNREQTCPGQRGTGRQNTGKDGKDAVN